MIFQFHLLSFSTGRSHPLAEQPVIFICTKSLPLDICNVVIEIFGDFLVLLVTFLEESDENEMFFVVLWKRGKAHRFRSPPGTYIDFTVLSQDIIVIPNLNQNMVEATKIVIDSDGTPRLMLLCMFHLPPLTRGASLSTLYSHSEPNPTMSGPVATSSPPDIHCAPPCSPSSYPCSAPHTCALVFCCRAHTHTHTRACTMVCVGPRRDTVVRGGAHCNGLDNEDRWSACGRVEGRHADTDHSARL